MRLIQKKIRGTKLNRVQQPPFWALGTMRFCYQEKQKRNLKAVMLAGTSIEARAHQIHLQEIKKWRRETWFRGA